MQHWRKNLIDQLDRGRARVRYDDLKKALQDYEEANGPSEEVKVKDLLTWLKRRGQGV